MRGFPHIKGVKNRPRSQTQWDPIVKIRAQRSQSRWDPIEKGGWGGTKRSKIEWTKISKMASSRDPIVRGGVPNGQKIKWTKIAKIALGLECKGDPLHSYFYI